MSCTALLFAPFRLDLDNEELWRDTDRVSIRPKTFAVLRYLARHPQRLITKQELLEHVWPGVSVDEELLRGYIRELRRLLGDTATSSRFIETVTRRGYRFLPDVVEDAPAEEQQPCEPAGGGACHVRSPVAVGILHSLTGMMARTETPVVDATLLAIEEINQDGGIQGRPIRPIVVDGQSDEAAFAREAEHLITTGRVAALFGCWTSACRKAVRPIVEQHDHLLLYPVQYEGLEQSPNIVYTGAAPNQQIVPALRWAFGFLHARRFFLVGWDSISSCAAHEIMRDEIAALGGEIVGEARLAPDGTDVPRTVRRVSASRADLVINSTVGDLNVLYSHVLRAAGVTPEKTPTLYLSVGEIELLSLSNGETNGDYAAWNYFQSLDRPENRAFVDRFRTRYGPQRVIGDPMEASYIGVHVWAQAAREADADDIPSVRRAMQHQTFQAPEGSVRIDAENQHTWKTMRLGRITGGGQLETIWSSETAIRPEPFPASRSRAEWQQLLADCYERWGRHWTKPRAYLRTS
jgi:urea transport system substrate-binding protein